MLEFGLPDLKRKTSAAADLVFPKLYAFREEKYNES